MKLFLITLQSRDLGKILFLNKFQHTKENIPYNLRPKNIFFSKVSTGLNCYDSVIRFFMCHWGTK